MESIAILLSTYNGEQHLASQLESIIKQTAKNWKIYIRDDGSDDTTLDIIREYITSYDNIFFLEESDNFGAALSFMQLLKKVDSDYYMFCDQDDIWLPEKIKNSYEFLKNKEALSPGLPILVFSDAKIVNSRLELVRDSFIKNSGINVELLSNKSYVKITNLSPGCTYIFNKYLRQIVLEFPHDIPMHDWWLVLKANQCGELFFLKESDILYRQHDKNVIGAVEVNRKYYLHKLLFLITTIKSQFSQYLFLKKLNLINNIFEYYYLKIKFKILK